MFKNAYELYEDLKEDKTVETRKKLWCSPGKKSTNNGAKCNTIDDEVRISLKELLGTCKLRRSDKTVLRLLQ